MAGGSAPKTVRLEVILPSEKVMSDILEWKKDSF